MVLAFGQIKDRIPFSMLNVGCWMFDVHPLKNLLSKNHPPLFHLAMILMAASLLFCVPVSSLAAEDTGLEEALEGFDDDTPGGTDASMEEVMDGFDDTSAEDGTEDIQATPPSETDAASGYPTLSIGGAARFRAFYNYAKDAPSQGETDWRGVSSLRGDLLVEVESKFSASWQAKVSLWGYYDAIYDIHGSGRIHPGSH